MEKLVMIREQLPLQERNYTDRNGQPQVFASVGFVLTDGTDTFYAELTGDRARACQTLDKTTFHSVQCEMGCREFTDRDGIVRHSTEIRILKIV